MRNYLKVIIKYRKSVLLLTAILTVALLYQLKSLTIIIDPDSTLPQSHPIIVTGNLIEKTFGNKFNAVIGITANEGTIFQKPILEKVQRITARIQNIPLAVKSNITSLSARKSKNIAGNAEGMIVKPLMDKVPETPEQMAELKRGIDSNPVYSNLLLSKDSKTTLIVAEFKRSPGGFKVISDAIEAAVAPERDQTVTLEVSGIIKYLTLLEEFSGRMGYLFPLALLIIGLIHYEAFRTLQALILPLVTALLSVIWSVGVLGLLHEPFDVFNASTPILILAIAAGHAVQILKRYYEEFGKAVESEPGLSRKELSELAVLNSLTKVGPVMIAACTVAALGFFSLMVFDLKSVRTFGVFSGAGVLSALVLELTFIPALRVTLRPPGDRETTRESHVTIWDRIVGWFYEVTMHHRKAVYIVVGLSIVVLSLGGVRLNVEDAKKYIFAPSVEFMKEDTKLNSRLAGTNAFYALIDGPSQDSIKRPDVLNAIDGLQSFINKQPEVGKTLSIVDFIKKMNQSMNADRPEAYSVPESQDLVAQYLLLYSNSGEPGDFDSYVDNDYQKAVVTTFLRTDSSITLTKLKNDIEAFAKEHFPKDVRVSMGGGSLGAVALTEIMVHEKILNIAQIMGAVFLISSLVFGSMFAGLLILVPLIAAVAVNFGVMGILGIPLQVATALISAMAVGIGADYGIYMSYRMREELRNDADEARAIQKAFRSAGKAALFVSTAVAGGFGVLMLSSGFYIHIWMGFLIGLAMLVSSITSLTLFPALIFTFRPKFIFGKAKSASQPVYLKVAKESV